MAENSKIEWCDATWNHIVGCSVVSPGCTNCYAMRLAGTRMANHPTRHGLTTPTKAGPVWNGQVRFLADKLIEPLRWKRPRRIFVCAHGDLFHDSVPDEWIDRTFAVMALAPQHTFQVLTKRPKRMRAWAVSRFTEGCRGAIEHRARQIAREAGIVIPQGKTIASPDPLPHVWLGVSVEDQRRADERIPDLLATPAAVRWISAEPLLGPVDLTTIAAPDDNDDGAWKFNALTTGDYYSLEVEPDILTGNKRYDSGDGPYREAQIDWVVAGGESGPGARPTHPDWARALRDQCKVAGVAFFWKQWGDWKDCSDLSSDAKVVMNDGRSCDFGAAELVDMDRQTPVVLANPTLLCRVGKKAAGRLLDGVTHDEYPSAPSHSGRRG